MLFRIILQNLNIYLKWTGSLKTACCWKHGDFTSTMMAKMGTVGMLRLGHQAQRQLKIYKVGKRWPLWPKAKATSWKPGFLSIHFTVHPKSTWIWLTFINKNGRGTCTWMQSEGIWHVEHPRLFFRFVATLSALKPDGQCEKPGWNLTTMRPCGHTSGTDLREKTCTWGCFD